MDTQFETNTDSQKSITYKDYCIWNDGKYLIEADEFPSWTTDPLDPNLTLFRNKDRAQFHIDEYGTQYDVILKKNIPGKLSGALVREISITTTTIVKVGKFANMEYENVNCDYSRLSELNKGNK